MCRVMLQQHVLSACVRLSSSSQAMLAVAAAAAVAPSQAFVAPSARAFLQALTAARSSTLRTAAAPSTAAVAAQAAVPTMGLWGQVAPRAAALAFSVPTSLTSGAGRQITIFLAVAAAAVTFIVKLLDKPSRPYNREANTVGNEYDAWCEVCSNTTNLLIYCSACCFYMK